VHRRVLAAIVAGTLALAGLAGCEPMDGPAAAPLADAQVSAALDTLTVAEWAPMTGYSRDRFHHWDSQGGGCDTRDVVLQRDGTGVVTGAECKISKGTWFSEYDGKTFTDPQDLDIDHMVPLANAWRTGAASWTDAQRESFANDLSRPQLHAVSLSSNRSKGDQDPSQWKPRPEFWCTYARDWVSVKVYWKLSVTSTEKSALLDMLATCPASS
jgi:hypothetical protein